MPLFKSSPFETMHYTSAATSIAEFEYAIANQITAYMEKHETSDRIFQIQTPLENTPSSICIRLIFLDAVIKQIRHPHIKLGAPSPYHDDLRNRCCLLADQEASNIFVMQVQKIAQEKGLGSIPFTVVHPFPNDPKSLENTIVFETEEPLTSDSSCNSSPSLSSELNRISNLLISPLNLQGPIYDSDENSDFSDEEIEHTRAF